MTDSRPLQERIALERQWIQSQGVDWSDLIDGGLKVFVEGRGATLTDVRGRTFLDGLSGLFVVAIGHGRTKIAAAMAEQAGRLAYVAASRFSTEPTARLAETLGSLTGGELTRTHFCSSGSEANETALKIAKQAQRMRGFPDRYKVIARLGSYHGATQGAMSVTSTSSEAYFGPFVPGTSYVPSPNHYRNPFGLDGRAGDIRCAEELEREILRQGPETVAAVIGEPVSNANGIHVPDRAYWQMIRDVCDRYGIFLIMDEVVNGFGRTGTMFGFQQFGVVPDMITLAKGLSSGYAPIGAVVARESLFEDFQRPGASLSHLITFGGHPVSAAAANANLEILLEEKLVDRSVENGLYLLSLMRDLEDSHPTVGEARGIGMLCGIELVKSKATKEPWGMRSEFLRTLQEGIERRGLVTRAWDVTFLAPPLVTNRAQLETMVEILDESLTEVESTFAAEIDAA